MKIEKKYVWIVLALIMGILLISYNQKFAITDNDFMLIQQNYINIYNNTFDMSYVNGTILLNNQGVFIPLTQGQFYYRTDNESGFYTSIPSMIEGKHNIIRARVTLTGTGDSNDTIYVEQWIASYTKETNTVYQNVSVPTYIYNGTQYINQTVYQNVTVTKTVTVQPTITDLFKQYQMYILGIAGIALVYYLTRRKK